MSQGKGWLRALMMTATLAGALAPGVAAGSEFLVVEAEERTADAGECSLDGESMRTVPAPWGSGEALEYPNDLCWADWSLLFASPIQGVRLFFMPPNGGGSGVVECVVWDLAIDGVFAGSTPEHCAGPNGANGDPVELEVGSGIGVPDGSHTLRLTVRFTQGPAWANAYVDVLRLAPAPPPPPPLVCHEDALLNVCLRPTFILGRFLAVGPDAPEGHRLAGHVDRYAFAVPGGGEVLLPCVSSIVDGTEVNACAAAGGSLRARVATLVDEGFAVQAPDEGLVRVCLADLTITGAGFGVEGVPVRAPC